MILGKILHFICMLHQELFLKTYCRISVAFYITLIETSTEFDLIFSKFRSRLILTIVHLFQKRIFAKGTRTGVTWRKKDEF